MDGRDGPRVQSTRAFLRNFAGLDPAPVALWDERLSTAAVERALIANDVSRARRAEVVDKMAAAYILQGALDRLAGLRSPCRLVEQRLRMTLRATCNLRTNTRLEYSPGLFASRGGQ